MTYQQNTGYGKTNHKPLFSRLFSHLSAAVMLATVSTLSGCAVMGDNFDCNKIGGLQGCVSLNDVNKMTKNGQIGVNGYHGQSSNTNDNNGSSQASIPPQGSLTGYQGVIPNMGQPVREGDTIQQVTIFPYEDSQGNYHESSMVYTILQGSHWIAYPVSQVQTDDSEV